MWAIIAFVLFVPSKAHVPGYGCVENCCKPTHPPTVSQAFYTRAKPGTIAGLEYHVLADTVPFDIPSGETIYWDAVFKEEYDTSTFALRVGCGGARNRIPCSARSPFFKCQLPTTPHSQAVSKATTTRPTACPSTTAKERLSRSHPQSTGRLPKASPATQCGRLMLPS